MKLDMLDILYGGTIHHNKEKNRQVRSESSFLTQYVLGLLSLENFFDVRRINIYFDRGDRNEGVLEIDRVLMVSTTFDDSYFSLNESEKIRFLIEMLRVGLKEAFSYKQWDYSVVERILDNIPHNFCKNVFYTKLRCYANGYRAKVKCIQTMYDAKFIIEVYKGRKFIKQSLPYITKPDSFLFTTKIEKLLYDESKGFVLKSNTYDQCLASVRV